MASEGVIPGVDEQGALPLPWLGAPLAQAASLSRSHALLAHGPAGVGQLEFALTLAQAWLCETPAAQRPPAQPCGHCEACRQVRGRTHPDLLIVVPDALALALGWATEEDLRLKSEAKPSKQLRVEQVRDAIDWGQRTSARGTGKVIVLHPADTMNHTAASALLKTLEEPPGLLRLVLTSEDPEALLPTVRSRCQQLRLALPPAEQALAWLQAQNVGSPADAAALLAAAGGRPLQAWRMAADGVNGALLQALPGRVAAGDAAPLSGKPLPLAIDLLLKLAHDASLAALGASPRFFPQAQWAVPADAEALAAWQRSLLRAARFEDHPWNAGLLLESLVTEAASLWPAATRAARGSR
jgi:DNA polymerase-3 subunit delta'